MRSAALAAVDRLDAPTVAALRHRGIALPEFNTRIASRKVLDAVVSDLRATTEWTRTKIRRGVLVLAA